MPSPPPIDKARERELERYVEVVGRGPTEIDPAHPLAWQWEYRGTRDERELLLDMLREEDAPEPPAHEQHALDL